MTEEQHHWEERGDRHVIVCDQPGCNWEGTAYASQFSIHHERHHTEQSER